MSYPRFSLIYYKSLLDNAFSRFFEDWNSQFQKNEADEYILSKDISRQQIEKIFSEYIRDEIVKIASPYSLTKLDFCIVIGSCWPKDNIILKYKGKDFPEKLDKLLSDSPTIKYLLREKDIKINIEKFNLALVSLFDKLFRSRKAVEKLLGRQYKNVIFMSHSQLDCYLLFKLIKCIFGRPNCRNLYAEKMPDSRRPLVAVNDLVSRRIDGKDKLNKSSSLKKIASEVKLFLDEKMKEIVYG